MSSLGEIEVKRGLDKNFSTSAPLRADLLAEDARMERALLFSLNASATK
jgi:hypothetical protein